MFKKFFRDPLLYVFIFIAFVWAYAYWNHAQADNVALSWSAPTEELLNCDSQPVTDLAGYRIYMLLEEINDPTQETTIINIPQPSGDVTFVATAFKETGEESINSNRATKTLDPLEVSDPTAFTSGKIDNGQVLFVAGTVPVGTQ